MRIAFKAILGAGALLATAPAYAAGGGLPQLDASTYSSQVIWLVVSFIALYLLMSNVALPRISEVLEERQNRIDDNLARAEELKNQAEAAAEAYERSLAEARARAFDAIREAKEQGTAEATRRQATLAAELSDKISQAEQEINKARQDAISGIGEMAGEITKAAIAKLTGDEAAGASVSGAVAGALKGRG